MRYIKYILLILIIFNIPSFVLLGLEYKSVSSVLSYFFFILLLFFYLYNTKQGFAFPFVLIGLSYYIFSISQSVIASELYYTDSVKYFITIIGGYELAKRCKLIELAQLLLIASVTIILQPIFLPDDYGGRASGVYLNPNTAGFICIIGYSLTYAIEQRYFKIIGQVLFTFTGLLTFSRTFILIWLIVNIASLWISVKNIRVFFIAFATVAAIFSFSQLLGFSSVRLDQLQDIINAKAKVSDVNSDSRVDTWAKYYDNISENPIFGNGFGTFIGNGDKEGVHNSYLLVMGEAGIIAFITFSGAFLSLIYRSLKHFKDEPYLFFVSISIALYLLTNHNFFSDYNILFFSLWLYYQMEIKKTKSNFTPITPNLNHQFTA